MSNETTAFDIVTVVIAGYAALVGTFALAFQTISWLRSWSTRVEVRLGRYELHTPNVGSESVVLFHLVNHSSHEVKVTHVGFARQRRKGPAFVITRPWPVEQPLPIPIPPRDSRDVWTKPDQLPEGLNRDKKVRALISTSDGKSFKSKPVAVSELADPQVP
ncbi:MAG: hypothetical protein ACM3JL_01085 [Nitrososphaerota archaeon]